MSRASGARGGGPTPAPPSLVVASLLQRSRLKGELRSPAGRLPHQTVVLDCFSVSQLGRVRATILLPLGLEVSGTLVALGEDDRLLARLTVEGAAVDVRLEPASDEDAEREAWLTSLRASDPELRKVAVQQLGSWNDTDVVEALAHAAAADRELAVRIAALESLGDRGEDAARVLPTVAACLGDAAPFVRYWATYALGRMGAAAKDTLPALEALTSDREDGPRYGAADAIRRIRAALSTEI
ncbi:MAG: HEAT repeat domain-containing protein [Sandaracinaceae bacterium]|nr:HEAT repeat domain-containing protein [Sandaracinaceae bacterium]